MSLIWTALPILSTASSPASAGFNAYEDEYCFKPLHVYEGFSGKLITAVLRPGKTPSYWEIIAVLKRIVRRLKEVWTKTRLFSVATPILRSRSCSTGRRGKTSSMRSVWRKIGSWKDCPSWLWPMPKRVSTLRAGQHPEPSRRRYSHTRCPMACDTFSQLAKVSHYLCVILSHRRGDCALRSVRQKLMEAGALNRKILRCSEIQEGRN